VPASRIIGGYTVQDGVIVPNFSHAEIIGAVFHRTRIPVGIMTAAKLLSAVEPVIRYHRQRFRGGDGEPGSPRHDLGIQQKEDALHRLVDVWAMGEAAASLGFDAARKADLFDPMERAREEFFAAEGITGGRAQLMALRKKQDQAVELVAERAKGPDGRNDARIAELESDLLAASQVLDAELNVIIPACKLWNTGQGATMMREAVSLVGGYGITEDCPGFLGHKWMDAQLEATYEGPEAVQRRHLTATMTNPVFLAQMRGWIEELGRIAAEKPGMGACSLASAMRLWLWSLDYLAASKDAEGRKLYHNKRQGVTFPLADALCWLLAARCLIADVLALEENGPMNPVVAEGLEGMLQFYRDVAAVQCARAAGEASRVCTELVYGYHCHPDCGGACCTESGPDAEVFAGSVRFSELRAAVDGCLSGSRLAKDRAARALTQVMIPEALDYPL
jgi:alkylation response protein AidB-like acyl-CoA dehydrogenase